MGPVLFVTHGNRSVGFGHVRRCLSLAVALRKRSVGCEFLLDGDATVAEIVSGSGFVCSITKSGSSDAGEAIRLIKTLAPAAVVADSYTFTTDYLRRLTEAGRPVVAIDDLADRELPVALVVNCTVGMAAGTYRSTSPARLLLGPTYALLRPEFAEEPSRSFPVHVGTVLLTLGGSDPANLMPRLMRWIAAELEPVQLNVVAGPLSDDLNEIKTEAAAIGPRALVHQQPDDMRGLMLNADLAVSGGGQTLYELAATATPTVAIRLADNQTSNLVGFEAARVLTWAGDAQEGDLEAKVRAHLRRLAKNPQERAAMAAAGRSLVDGRGAGRVAAAVAELAEQERD